MSITWETNNELPLFLDSKTQTLDFINSAFNEII